MTTDENKRPSNKSLALRVIYDNARLSAQLGRPYFQMYRKGTEEHDSYQNGYNSVKSEDIATNEISDDASFSFSDAMKMTG